MAAHYRIGRLNDICIPLYHILPPLQFTVRFQVPLNFRWSYLSELVKVNSLSFVLVVAHPMTTRLVVCVKVNNTTLCVSWILGQCISHKNTTKIWNFQLLCVPFKFEIGQRFVRNCNIKYLHRRSWPATN